MRIQGNLKKDYYDHIGQRFGEDPDVVYARMPIRHLPKNTVPWLSKNRFMTTEEPRVSHNGKGSCYYLEYVVAGPHVAIILQVVHAPAPAAEVLVGPEHEHLFTDPSQRSRWRGRTKVSPSEVHWPILPTKAELEALIKLVGAPVFRVQHWTAAGLVISEAVPNLGELGFAARVPAEQMWQDLYATLTNVLRKNPDKAPPVEVGNEYKIHAAGFDRHSFRHPVNPKPKPER